VTDTLESALKERQALTRAYRASKRAKFARAFEQEPRLKRFRNDIGHYGIDQAEEMIDAVRFNSIEWLRNTDSETRALALEIVADRIVQIRTRAGQVPFDDALPWEEDDVWQVCRKILA
jgi:hypothetical protein